MTERIKDSDSPPSLQGSQQAASSATDAALFQDAYKNGNSKTVKDLVLGGKADLVTDQMILEACSEGNLDMVKALTVCKSARELEDLYGFTFCDALTGGLNRDQASRRPEQAHVDVYKYLDERFGIGRYCMDCCMFTALLIGHFYISKYLLTKSWDLSYLGGETHLHMAVYMVGRDETDHERTVREVLSHEAEVDAQDENGDTALTMMILRAYQSKETIVANFARILVEEGGCNAVALAVCKKFDGVAEYLQTQGATLPKTALLYFAIQNRWDLVHRLLEDPELGADVNFRGKIKLCKQETEDRSPKEMEHGSTLLMAAAQQDNSDEISWLLAQGADTNVLNEANRNALHFASSKEVCSLLVNAGANAHVPDTGGNTPLLCAIRSLLRKPAEESIGIIESLVGEARANVNHVNKEGDGVLNLICSPRFGAPRNDSDSSAILKNLLGRGLEVVDTKGDHALVAAATQPDSGMMINAVRLLVEARVGQGEIPRLSGQKRNLVVLRLDSAANKIKKQKTGP